MIEFKEVMLRAAEALWVAKLLLTADLRLPHGVSPHPATTRH